MASGKWQVASGKWQVASGEWQVASGKWQVASGKSGKWQVVSGDYVVIAKLLSYLLLTSDLGEQELEGLIFLKVGVVDNLDDNLLARHLVT